ncbi:alpha/beta hydrolase [Methylocystis sp. B8]|uniref:alpha/beta fold hydrolase n=1 Tax=Methylocystis sp. B8 TaxID=544938 RepID=UPI0010FE80BA|nr:alpha/beta hydrolase [Methylocystis sp. B8]TLG78998.1 alpha/beta hydrolase [Methylocystis sp. B8]
MASAQEPISRFIRAADGLRLHYFDYPAPTDGERGLLPVVCLPGLARSADDFDRIAKALQADGRRVLALDYRGRGRSDWDQDWRRYDFDVEQDDIAAQLSDAGVEQAVFIGTSRGGLHTMRIAARRPDVVGGAVLNDIGPKIEHAGLLRIKRYVGKLPPIPSMREAIALMRMTAGVDFSGVSAKEWEDYARLTFVEKDGKVLLRYDPELSHTLDGVKPDVTPEEHWDDFDALSHVPILAIRGANSDILSPEVFEEMARRAPRLEQALVEGQGHAPLLLDQSTILRIADFIRKCP